MRKKFRRIKFMRKKEWERERGEREMKRESEREQRELLSRRVVWEQRAVHHTCNAASTAR